MDSGEHSADHRADDGHLGQLKGDGAGMADDAGTDLDQLSWKLVRDQSAVSAVWRLVHLQFICTKRNLNQEQSKMKSIACEVEKVGDQAHPLRQIINLSICFNVKIWPNLGLQIQIRIHFSGHSLWRRKNVQITPNR